MHDLVNNTSILLWGVDSWNIKSTQNVNVGAEASALFILNIFSLHKQAFLLHSCQRSIESCLCPIYSLLEQWQCGWRQLFLYFLIINQLSFRNIFAAKLAMWNELFKQNLWILSSGMNGTACHLEPKILLFKLAEHWQEGTW